MLQIYRKITEYAFSAVLFIICNMIVIRLQRIGNMGLLLLHQEIIKSTYGIDLSDYYCLSVFVGIL